MEAGIAEGARPFLLVAAGTLRCAIPLVHVVETMRPLALTAVAHLPGVPAHVMGMSAVRGTPLVVVDLAGLLGQPGVQAARFVVVRAGERRIGLLVNAVLGIVAFPAHAL